MVLDDLTFLTTVNVDGNRIPRRLVPKIRKALKVFSEKDRRPKIFAQYGKLIVIGVVNDWLDTICWIIEHYYIVEGVSETSFGTFYAMASCLTRTKNRYWIYVKGYDCDGFVIPPHKSGVTVDHAVIFIDGVIALKVETHNGKYFIADYFVGCMSPRTSNKITYLWYDHEREHFERV